jgi:hypothetical protein
MRIADTGFSSTVTGYQRLWWNNLGLSWVIDGGSLVRSRRDESPAFVTITDWELVTKHGG